MEGSPITPPGGQFPIPATSSSPLFAFRCAPAIKPYLPEDATSPAGILVDTFITYSEIASTAPISIPENGPIGDVVVTVKVGEEVVTGGIVPLNATKFELSFSLLGLKPQTSAYDVSCSATYVAPSAKIETFTTSTTLSYLPDPPDGRSVTKTDLRTGALLAKPATGKGGAYEPVFPVGFYTDFGGYLASNLSLINEIKDMG